MIPVAAVASTAQAAQNVLGQAGKIASIFGQSSAFQSRQAVRDEYYAVLRTAGDYFKTKGDAGARALTYMNSVYADNGSARTVGEGPNSAHLTALKSWLQTTYGELEAASPTLAGVGSGLSTKAFGIPLWALLAIGGALAWFFFGRKGA